MDCILSYMPPMSGRATLLLLLLLLPPAPAPAPGLPAQGKGGSDANCPKASALERGILMISSEHRTSRDVTRPMEEEADDWYGYDDERLPGRVRG